MTFLFIVLGAIAILLFVTRVAGRRDALRKAEIARRKQTEHGGDGDDHS